MQIVIDIPEEYYNFIKNNEDRFSGSRIYDCVLNGTVLPKGHGRLIDVSEYYKGSYNDAREFLDNASTIIEADKEVKNE